MVRSAFFISVSHVAKAVEMLRRSSNLFELLSLDIAYVRLYTPQR
jgi:hypothetical protein